MKTKWNKYDVIINIFCLLILLGLLIYLGANWSHFPSKIPGHYNAMGEVDRWGNKSELLVLPIVAWIMYIGITILEQLPQIWNTGVTVTEKNRERIYRTLKNMIDTLKMLIVAIFSFLSINTSLAMQLPAWFLPVSLVLTFGVVIVFIIRLIRIK